MKKIPYTYALLLPTLSPAAKIAIYIDGEMGLDELYKGVAIKSRDREDLLSCEVRHIGINERNKLKNGESPLIEIFVDYDTIRKGKTQ